MKYNAAIFDMDGTLLESMHIWRNLGILFLRKRGIEPEPTLNKEIISLSIEEAISYCCKKYNLQDTKQEIHRELFAIVEDFYFNHVECKPGVVEFLRDISRRGVKMSVATMTDKKYAVAALKRNGIYELFSEVLCCSDIGASKQSPLVYDTALANLGAEKEKTLVFEDALYAVRTAKQAGYTVVGLYDDFEPENEQLQAECHIYAHALGDVGLSEKLFG